MNKPILVFPCKYDFDFMDKTEVGSFCKHCNKVVKDYSKLSGIQFQNELAITDKNSCGRFRKDQVTFHSNTLFIPGFKEVSLSILSLLGASFIPNQSIAQTIAPAQHISKTSSALSKLKFPLTIKGTLKEKSSNLPISYSKVLFRQKGKDKKSVYTDKDGNFSILLKRIDVVDTNFQLILSQAGYKGDTLSRSINNTKETLLIKMDISIEIVDYVIPLIDPVTISGGAVFRLDTDSAKSTDAANSKKKLSRKEKRKLKNANAKKQGKNSL